MEEAVMTSKDVSVVVGAGGVTGREVVRRLVRSGRAVRAVTRNGRDVGTPGVEPWAADAGDLRDLTVACQGAATVYHCAMPPLQSWGQQFPAMTDAIIGAAEATGARVVYADDTWMYGRVSGPMTEDLPYRPVSRLGVLRAWLAERFQHAAAAGRAPVSIVRAGELYGPGVRSVIAANVFGAVRRGRTVRWLGDPDLPITPTLVDDFAQTLVAVGGADTSDSSVWHVPHPEPTTGRTLAALAAEQAGSRFALRSYGSRTMQALGLVMPLAREAADLVYQFEQPFVVDGSRAAGELGVSPTPYAEGVRRTLASYDLSRSLTGGRVFDGVGDRGVGAIA
jgi:nucleoside-diphosphate-sugar epimerase